MSIKSLQRPYGKTIIGLTGNIATGKSAVMRLAAERGASTIDADRVVHRLQDSDPDVQEAIVAQFGPGVRLEDGRIDRPAVGRIVFKDREALRELEAIMHPAVYSHVDQIIRDSPETVIMIEAIKLLQGQFRPICEQVWVTDCSRELQLKRLQICRGWDKLSAESRIDGQDSQNDKVSQADFVIDTNGLMKETAAQFDIGWARIITPTVGESLDE